MYLSTSEADLGGRCRHDVLEVRFRFFQDNLAFDPVLGALARRRWHVPTGEMPRWAEQHVYVPPDPIIANMFGRVYARNL